jgi:outer membrane protein, heavy metal efflux system
VLRRLLLLSTLLFSSGCYWTVREETDMIVHDLVEVPFDTTPPSTKDAAKPASSAGTAERTSSSSRSVDSNATADPNGNGNAPDQPPRSGQPAAGFSSARSQSNSRTRSDDAFDVQTSAILESDKDPSRVRLPLKDRNVQTAAWSGERAASSLLQPGQAKVDLHIPQRLPGAEAPDVDLPKEGPARQRAIDRFYGELPPVPAEPKVLPGPGGKPYTLADLQRLAAANSPTLRQAAADVKAAEGNLIQAKTYPNPTVSYLVDPSNNNSTAGVQGGAIDQPIITGGKMKLGVAAAQKNLDNAILALKRARSDLSTSVRNAYFTILVDVETLVLTRALVQFSDDIYRLQVGLLRAAQQVAPYEATALRAQTQINRLAYINAIQSYIYDWKALVATLGLPQLPLAQIAGEVDRFIPYYDFDDIRGHVLEHHTDVLTARNTVRIAQYNLKVAQVTPIFPNLDVRYSLEKDFALGPFGTYQTLALGFPLPIWDQNKGNIIAAKGALIRASEESHRVEVSLTNSLALAYENYRNNLYSMEMYRRDILPDLVRYYRGAFDRRQIDAGVSFGDLIFAQQNFTTNVQTYIGLLGNLWSSVVGVADFLQTNDLYQLATRQPLPGRPEFKAPQMPAQWACGHDTLAEAYANGAFTGTAALALQPAPAGLSVPAGPAGSNPNPPAPASAAGAGTAPPPPQGVQPRGAPPGGPPQQPLPAQAPQGGAANNNASAWLDRWLKPGKDAAARLKAYVGNANGPAAPDQPLIVPTAMVQPIFGKEVNHDGQTF